MTKSLKKAPTVERFAASKDPKASSAVDREDGRYGAGMIKHVSLCSRGEALGHYMWVDNFFLAQLLAVAPTEGKLLKCRFTHPDWCSDGMGKALGTFENFSLEGDQLYGDLHFYASAHGAPDGDLAAYVMNLAEEDPANFGTSIVFSRDWDAECEFVDENIQDVELKDDSGKVVETRRQFVSPDELNTEHLRHCRLSEFRACDVVDEPAANPNGLFHREDAVLKDGKAILDFVFGQSTDVPALSSALGVDVAPERLKTFVGKYLAKHGLTVGDADPEKDGTMPLKSKSKLAEGEDPKDEKKPEGETKPEDKKEDPPAEEKKDDSAGDDPEDDEEVDDEDKKEACSDPSKKELAKYCKAFGNERGAEYFLAGKSFEDAQTEHSAALAAENKELKEKLAAFANLGVDPVAFSAASDKGRDKTNGPTAPGSAEAPANYREQFAALNK